MKKLVLVALAAASCILGSSAALAAYVTDYQNGVLLGSWTQSMAPTPISFVTSHYTVVPITNGTGAAFGYDYAYWYAAADHGGLVVGGPFSVINTGGPQSYAGSEMVPLTVTGIYHEDDGSIVTVSVPEPATWATMILGLGMAGFAMRRRRKVSVTVA